MTISGNELLLRRVESLERESRRWRAGALAVSMLLIGLVFMGAGGGAKEAKLKKLTIVNEAGMEVATLGVDSYGKPRLAFYDEQQKLLLELGTNLGSHAWFQGSDGESCVQLGVWRWADAAKEVPSMRFSDNKGMEKIKIGYDLNYRPALEICCKAGRVVTLSGDE